MGIAIDSNQLQGLRAGLRKVSVGTPPETNSHEPKEYGEIEQSVSAVKRKFQDKAEGKPGRPCMHVCLVVCGPGLFWLSLG